MTMNLNTSIFEEIKSIQFFKNCGNVDCSFEFNIKMVDNWENAIKYFESSKWQDIKTEAQGDLTGFLAKTYSNQYAGYWNKLSKEAQTIIHKDIYPLILSQMTNYGYGKSALKIEVDLSRIAMEYAYLQFRPPTFFSKILAVYKAGHLPCGWNGEWDKWPVGEFLVF